MYDTLCSQQCLFSCHSDDATGRASIVRPSPRNPADAKRSGTLSQHRRWNSTGRKTHIQSMAKPVTVTFDPRPVKTGASWQLIATHPSGHQEDIAGFHTETEAIDWLSSSACAAWLRTRGYRPGAFPARSTK